MEPPALLLIRKPAGPEGRGPQVLKPWHPRRHFAPKTCGFNRQKPSGSLAGMPPDTAPAENLRAREAATRGFSVGRAPWASAFREPAALPGFCPQVLGREGLQRAVWRRTYWTSGPEPSGSPAKSLQRAAPAEYLRNDHHSVCRLSARHSLEVLFSENLRISSAVSRGFSAGRSAGAPLSREPADATGCGLQALEGRAAQAAPRRRTCTAHPRRLVAGWRGAVIGRTPAATCRLERAHSTQGPAILAPAIRPGPRNRR